MEHAKYQAVTRAGNNSFAGDAKDLYDPPNSFCKLKEGLKKGSEIRIVSIS